MNKSSHKYIWHLNYKLVIFISVSIVTLFSSVVYAEVQDNVKVLLPAQNAFISTNDKVTIEWSMDDDQQSPEAIDFQIVLSPDGCGQEINAIDILATDDDTYEINANVYTYSWDVSNTAQRYDLSEGQYCIQICGTLLNELDELYGVCDTKDIDLSVGTSQPDIIENNFPEITSLPKTLNIKTGNKFSYQVIAQDPDKDELYYYMSIGPDFLSFDAEIGLLSSIGGLITEGLYEVKLVVQDNKGGWDEQLFIIKISDKPFYELKFSEPNQYSKNIKGNTSITWDITPETNIDSIVLSYTQDGIEWTDFVTLEADKQSYDWDITTLSGEYYVKLLVASTEGELYEVISDKFTILSFDGSNEDILVSIKYPKNDTLISEQKPLIEVELTPSTDATLAIVDITLKLNDIALDCVYEGILLSCQVTESLEKGDHVVKLDVKDSAGKMINQEWKFTIGDEIEASADTLSLFGKNISKSAAYLGIGILCIVILLLLVAWTLYYVYKRRKTSAFGNVDKSALIDGYNPAPPADMYGNPVDPSNITGDYTTSYDTPVSDISPDTSAAFTPEIGEQSLGDTSDVDNYSAVAPIGGAQPVQSDTTVGELSMPSSYSNEEIPEWLKDFESDQPVSTVGGGYTSELNSVNQGAKVHDDYGIALNSDDGGDKK